ncbi:hypothetical protein [Flavobacterium frigoris]|uniref:Excinuclease ABC subunit B n=1 Tax=Flavobacterium frigoris (strain PS1) TaxID=1086011 RepID=H7FT70_FLAFP|nr:hypothetical protein [Flavobacterium frigoris]EIA08124.1 hypothetical protein HJ01_01846 [Flavobacterium frigoris PS1]
MNTYEEKKSLLLEMIAFSTVDGHLNKREYEFLFLIANELNIEKGGFNDLFHQELPKLPLKTGFQRIQQFYRLALLLYNDGVLHVKESVAIKEIAMRMGLNSEASKRILKKVEKSPKTIISSAVLMKIFKEEQL